MVPDGSVSQSHAPSLYERQRPSRTPQDVPPALEISQTQVGLHEAVDGHVLQGRGAEVQSRISAKFVETPVTSAAHALP